MGFPDAGAEVLPEVGVGEGSEGDREQPAAALLQNGEGENPEQVPGMQRRGEEERRPQKNDCGSDRISRPAGDPQSQPEQDGPDDRPLPSVSGDEHRQEEVGPFVEAPSRRVDPEPLQPLHPRAAEGEDQGGHSDEEAPGQAHPSPVEEGGDQDSGHQLHQRRDPDQGAGPLFRSGWPGRTFSPGPGEEKQHRAHQRKDPQRFQMAAPGDLDRGERAPEKSQEHLPPVPSGAFRDPRSHLRRRQFERGEESPEKENGSSSPGDQEEEELRRGRIDGGNVRVIDPVMPGRSEMSQLGRGRSGAIGIEPGSLDLSVPQVSPQIIGQQRIRGEKHRTHSQGDAPDHPGIHAPPGRALLREDRTEGDEEPHSSRQKDEGEDGPRKTGHTARMSGHPDGEGDPRSTEEQEEPGPDHVAHRASASSRPAGGMHAGVVVIIPALDEEEALGLLLPLLRAQGYERVVVVDNGSSDATPEVARREGAHVVHEPRRGYGAACRTGVRIAGAMHPPPRVFLFVDADERDPHRAAAVLRPIDAGTHDLVLGVRTGPRAAIPWHARLGTALVLAAARALHGLEARDLGPLRAIRPDALTRLGMDDPTWGWTLQMQIRAARSGLRVLEIPLPHAGRSAGRSKISGSLQVSLRAGGRMFWTVFRERFVRRSPGL